MVKPRSWSEGLWRKNRLLVLPRQSSLSPHRFSCDSEWILSRAPCKAAMEFWIRALCLIRRERDVGAITQTRTVRSAREHKFYGPAVLADQPTQISVSVAGSKQPHRSFVEQ